MKRSTVIIYSVLISTIFVISLSFFGYNIYNELKHGNERTRKTFQHFTNQIEKNSNSANKDYLSFIENPSDFLAITIKENNTIMLKSPESLNDDFSNISNTTFVKVYSKRLIQDNKTIDINAALYTLRPSKIFHYASYSFVVILIATIFTIIVISYITITEKKQINYQQQEKKSETFSETHDKILHDDEKVITSTESQDKQTTITEETNVDNDEIEELEWPEHTFILESNNNDDITQIEEQNASTQDIPKKEQIEQYEKTDNYVTNPVPYTISTNETSEINKNIYSEITGISKEISLITKLENDLVHATSSEQDLSLFIIKIPGLIYSNEETKQIVNILLQQFLYRDTIFEFENDGFAVIKSDMTIEAAEEKADLIYKNIQELHLENPAFIGISSRSIRMLSAERLIKEAKEALNHAIEAKDESPIIGFHVDVEKYREYIKNN